MNKTLLKTELSLPKLVQKSKTKHKSKTLKFIISSFGRKNTQKTCLIVPIIHRLDIALIARGMRVAERAGGCAGATERGRPARGAPRRSAGPPAPAAGPPEEGYAHLRLRSGFPR